MALTQVCTHFLPQLCSALVSNSHTSDSDSAWPGTIFSHRVQFHLTGCILPLMHLTVACSLFPPLFILSLSVDLSCCNNFFLHTLPITHPLCFLLFTVCYSNPLSICAHKFFTRLPGHNLIIRSKKQKNVLLLRLFLQICRVTSNQINRGIWTSLKGDLYYFESEMWYTMVCQEQ